MTAAARQVYAQIGIGPSDLDAVKLYDCFTANELITYKAPGLTATISAIYAKNPSGRAYRVTRLSWSVP